MGNLGEQVNALIDNLLAVATRLLELPISVLLLLGILLCAGVLAALRKRPRKLLIAQAAILVLATIFVADRKIARIQGQLNDLRSRYTADAAASLSSATSRPSVRARFLFDTDKARGAMPDGWQNLTLTPTVYDQATDVVRVHSDDPLVQAYAVVIDLTHPGLTIQIGGSLQTKSLTSEFARRNACTVAVNGEAGLSPEANSGLGWYRGDLVERGEIMLHELPVLPRPFIYFDKNNHAGYRGISAKPRDLSSAMYNVMWGRLDAVVKGTVQTADERNRQPRTAMGINREGTLLYLLVVDGRQPGYSMGITRAEVGQVLAALGACNGMLCDEGGSSCIYVRRLGGICNIPSDNEGTERPTYTHFGISLSESEQNH